ncbi:MAG: ATP-binding cassette domain-containing protein [Dehalococcoidia bacterium]|nr:ATP-binding cassette domain-containing protein [Dehalococcoidia bacterium]MDP7240391.1 ATP-binding cassette domain-containing protein [Dehalococcoidia bacterium]MDP7469798.1 ATP-binding cassette domain-containing protein [Dehalococcoidia bacterium]
MIMPPIIQVEHLTRRFGDLTAVDDVSFEVAQGEVYGFLGPNGAGKSTTINILCTLLRPSGGHALVCGLDVVHSQDQVRRCIGLVFQDPSLDERMSAYENLEFHAMVYGVLRAERRHRLEEVLRMVGLWERQKDVVRRFSGGMRRRLEIARGLVHRPRILFLDEPTLGLDPQTRVRIWEHLHWLCREQGMTLFFTTHYMDEAEHADRIGVIDRGRLVALDSPDALKQSLGGDIIVLRTADNAAAAREIDQLFHLTATGDGDSLFLEVSRGSELIPTISRSLDTTIQSITLRRPTLDDVFLRLTGRELRDEEASGMETMRAWARTRMRREGGR